MLITISNTSKRVNENITTLRTCHEENMYVYMQNFMFVGVSFIEILEFNRKMKKNMQNIMFVGVSVIEILEFNWKMKKRTWQNCEIPYYKYYTGFIRFC